MSSEKRSDKEPHNRAAHLINACVFGSDEYRTDAENCWCNSPDSPVAASVSGSGETAENPFEGGM